MKHDRFSQEERVKRAFLRLSRFLYELWEEGDEADTRLFEKLIPDDYVQGGKSVRALDLQGGARREHIVPCAVLRNRVFERFENGASYEEVAAELQRFLQIILVHPDEANYIDRGELKSRMPEDWTFETGDPLARLKAAGITLA